MGLKLLLGGSPCTHWRPVPGYTGLYEVSEDGKVRNARTKRVLSRKTERNGYVRVHLSKDGYSKSVLLHRVVAAAFVPNPDGLPTVNHIDEDKANNAPRISNGLECLTKTPMAEGRWLAIKRRSARCGNYPWTVSLSASGAV